LDFLLDVKKALKCDFSLVFYAENVIFLLIFAAENVIC